MSSLSETVPVAQYANVIIGPVGLRWQSTILASTSLASWTGTNRT